MKNSSIVDKKALADFNLKYPDFYPLLKRQSIEWAKTQPLKGMRILHLFINSYETLLKLEPLILGGADVTVVDYDMLQLPYQKEVNDTIKKLGISFIDGFEYDKISGEFDFILDCQARSLEMPNVRATKGIVEITQQGTDKYQKALEESKINVPVINIDQTLVKEFECTFGTGDAFIRAFKHLTGDIPNKRFVIFGYGKVGKGICLNLVDFVSKENIVIVVKTEKSKNEAISKGFVNTFILQDQRDIIRELTQDCYAIVCATNVKGLLEKHFSTKDTGSAWLVSMGLANEFGDSFNDSSHLLSEGTPINFKLNNPTQMRFIDPAFWSHNRSIEIINIGYIDGKPRVVDFPKNECIDCLKYWAENVESSGHVRGFLKLNEL